MPRRDRYISQSLGASLTKRVKDSRVLLIGAGGIGCELLKNLVCCGFGTYTPDQQDQEVPNSSSSPVKKPEIVVVDLDTIDLSNLNRQFLFRKQHIKRPKALVAKETANKFNPAVRITAQHASIFDKQYNVEFFESFDMVFNALDNLAARRHVNRMCLAADVPLIESGTTGFNGQVQVIQKGITECYDCNPKPVQKSFPICTIRSTPSQPIHCIVWAKSYLFPELFGTSEEDSSDVAVTEGDNAEEVAKLKEEAEALKKVRGFMGQSKFAKEVFQKVFHDDIERLRSMTEMWQSRTAPESLGFENLTMEDDDSGIIQKGQALAMQDQSVWTIQQNVSVFCYSLDALSNRVQAGSNVIEFDKDDKDTLDFVASAANLRSHIFGIPMHSEWEIKQMAGNIIPAIATSNALTASLCVLEAFKIMKSLPGTANAFAAPTANNQLPTNVGNGNSNGHGQGRTGSLMGGAKMVFLNSRSTDRMTQSQDLVAPAVACPVCSPCYAKLAVPWKGTYSLQHLVDLLKDRFEYEEFSLTTEAGVIFDPDLDDNLGKSLAELGISTENNGFVTVVDDSDSPKTDLVLSVCKQAIDAASDSSAATPTLSITPPNLHLPAKAKSQPEAESNGHADDSQTLGKRKREADGDTSNKDLSNDAKRVKAAEDVVVVEDEGAIVLDDD